MVHKCIHCHCQLDGDDVDEHVAEIREVGGWVF